MRYIKTTALEKIVNLKKRLKIIQGGSSAGKTIAILLILIDRAQSERGKVFSVVSETMPHLKKGAIRDFLSIMEAHKYYNDDSWNKTDYIYKFETGTKIEFFSADSPDRVRGPRRDVLFINEANNTTFETFTQLAIRTNEDIYLDFNPVSEFWVHTDVIPKNPHDFIILTYKDNEALPQTIVNEIESRRENRFFWKVYGEGQLGEVEGKIYKDWDIIDEIPHAARLERYGLDFGYTNDPSSIIAIYRHNGGWILDEICYSTGMSNRMLGDVLKNQSQALVIADSAEPKSIDEIKAMGLTILPAEKGPDSVRNGIQLVQGERISMTKRSVNLIREYRNYLWETDRDGKILNVPCHDFSHSMDATRYGLCSILKKPVFKMPEATKAVAGYYPELGL